MDRIPYTVRYWLGVVLPQAFKNAAPISAVKDRLLDILSSFAVAALFILVYGQVIDPGLQVGFNINTLFYWLVVTFAGRLIVGLAYLPAKIYKEQGGFIKNPFEVMLLSHDFSNEAVQYATIAVRNRSKVAKIENCYIELVDVVDLSNGKHVWPEPQKLYWSTREMGGLLHEKKTIDLVFDTAAWCDIADVTIKENRAFFQTWYGRGAEFTEIKLGTYRLIIKAHGDFQNMQIDYLYSLDLIYQPDSEKRLEIRNIVPIEGKQ